MNPITMKLQADRLIEEALREDITSEDVSTNAVMPEYRKGKVQLLVQAGRGHLRAGRVSPYLSAARPGNGGGIFRAGRGRGEKGQLLAEVTGDIRVLLSGERVALNFLQLHERRRHLCAGDGQIARGDENQAARYAQDHPEHAGIREICRPRWRGYNHRYNLSDGVLLKDNHIGAAGGIAAAVKAAKAYAPFVRKIEIEVETLDQLK